MNKKVQIFILSAAFVLPNFGWGQLQKPQSTVTQWGISAGINHYKEPDLMQLQGPEIGLHARVYNFAQIPKLRIEGDVFLGQQKYTSTKTGSMNGVQNIETRWRILMPVFADTPSQQGLYTGIGIHTLLNDMRGTSSTGDLGYERSATQLWLPVRWVSNYWELEAGALIYGRHTSKLSQANTTPPHPDVVNTQRKGAYLQSKLSLQMDARNLLSPYLRYTYLDESDHVNAFYEPASKRWQTGVTWQFITP
jgi:hypothetical protein